MRTRRFNVTTDNRSGVFARGRGELDAFADRTRSFRNSGDRFCQGGASLAAHLNYRGSVGDAAEFVTARVG
jgi:hypothetical protein